MTLRAILFDFDGVIVESLEVKAEAFRALFAEEPEHLPTILDLHRANAGMSRYAKFEIIYRDILRRPLSPEDRERLGRRFAELVVEKVLACPLVPGALEFLRSRAAELPLFIASATPQDEIAEIVAGRGLLGYFREVHGSPRLKSEIARDILRRYGLTPGEMPFVGDAINDYHAAAEVGLPFVARVPPGAPSPFPASVGVVADLTELARALAPAVR